MSIRWSVRARSSIGNATLTGVREMATDYRNKMLTDLVAQRGLKTRGFRRALRSWVMEEYNAEECECTPDEHLEYMFAEYFGNCAVVPAAFKIEDDGAGWNHIHVYELAISARLPDSKISQYSRIADGDGPRCSLHVFDRSGKETVIENDTLQRFAFVDSYSSEYCWERVREECDGGGGATVVHEVHSTIHTTKPEERAILRAVYELGLFQPGDFK